mmetsp:Transcript_14005/g.19439  ORF Transcript_14005/g.19439 Transcript_14005/m.19439 type:complete len:605 (+) Transcript_14005:495-2309(+)
MNLLLKDGTEFWQRFNNLRRKSQPTVSSLRLEDGSITSNPLEIELQWMRHFNHLTSATRDAVWHTDADFQTRIEAEHAELQHRLSSNVQLDADISPEEVLHAIASARSGTAPGDDGIPIDFFKVACEGDGDSADGADGDPIGPFLSSLTALLQSVFHKGVWPRSWRIGLIAPLHKSKDPPDPSNCRGITFLPVLSKIMLSIFAKRIQEHAEIHGLLSEEQAGFRRLRSCQEHIHILVTTLGVRRSQGLKTFVCFLDFMKAHDCVWRKGTLVKLARCGITGKVQRVLNSSHKCFHRCMAQDSRRGKPSKAPRPHFLQTMQRLVSGSQQRTLRPSWFFINFGFFNSDFDFGFFMARSFNSSSQTNSLLQINSLFQLLLCPRSIPRSRSFLFCSSSILCPCSICSRPFLRSCSLFVPVHHLTKLFKTSSSVDHCFHTSNASNSSLFQFHLCSSLIFAPVPHLLKTFNASVHPSFQLFDSIIFFFDSSVFASRNNSSLHSARSSSSIPFQICFSSKFMFKFKFTSLRSSFQIFDSAASSILFPTFALIQISFSSKRCSPTLLQFVIALVPDSHIAILSSILLRSTTSCTIFFNVNVPASSFFCDDDAR